MFICSTLSWGLQLSIGVDRIRPGWLDGNLISGMNDGDNAVFLGGCEVFGILTLGKLTDVFGEDV